jgi:A/G-specific adenine glycosylase
MLQQTTVKAVGPYFEKFVTRWPDVTALARATLDDVLRMWAGLGYYSRARNLHACAVAVLGDHGGAFPDTEEALRALPGIGPYTAAAIAAIAFDAPATPIDGNVERVVTRLYAVEEQLPGAKPAVRRLAQGLTPARRAGDFAQALMDLGATICAPKKPACVLCPWIDTCAARARGDAETFPRKARKSTGALRRGAAFVVVRDDGRLLVRTRPAKGLLGGMTEVPNSRWAHDFNLAAALDHAPRLRLGKSKWRRIAGVVNHVFTHFPLELAVFRADMPARAKAPMGMRWISVADLGSEALPNVMRKAVAHAGVGNLNPSPRAPRRVARRSR